MPEDVRFHTNPTRVLLMIAFLGGCAREPVSMPVPERAARPPAVAEPTPQMLEFEATAYAIDGKTASGTRARRGVVAADPSVLPLGSRIRVHGAGSYSGEYVVTDTGPAVRGREIDIYVDEHSEAREFGRRRVSVEVLRRGNGDKP